MNLVSLGLSHATSPVALREHFAAPAAALRKQLVPRPGLDEYVVLSTCNRLEVYAILPGNEREPLLALLEQISGLGREVFGDYLSQYDGEDAVRHLARVAAGLESQVVGESQILGQVAEAQALARKRHTSGPELEAVFHSAVRAGKRARSETEIGRNPVSLSSVAVRLAQDLLSDLHEVRALVIGAGEMAALAVQTLKDRGAGQIVIVNRTLKAARELAARHPGARAATLKQLAPALAGADLVIASSGAPFVIVTPALLRRATSAGRNTPLLFIDIAVPRNVSPDVTQLPNIHYYDIDHLKDAQDEGRAARERAIPQVETIIAEEVAAWHESERLQQVAPVIAALRAKAETIRQAEIERTLRRWPGAGPAERERLEALTEAIVNRLLHQATAALKAGAGQEQAAHYAALLQELFALEETA